MCCAFLLTLLPGLGGAHPWAVLADGSKRAGKHHNLSVTMSQQTTVTREMPALDKIHILFLLYSAAHNAVNAFTHSGNFVFFIFVVVGILSVELMLWAVYNHWKDGRLIGPMLRASLWAGFFAMFYATAGILAQAQGGAAEGWAATYYAWIMPTSAPVMFVFAFLIQAVDPITNADRKATGAEHMTQVEERLEVVDKKMLTLDNRRNIRRLKAHVQHQRMDLLWRESMARRTRGLLKNSARIELPFLLKSIGVPVERAARLKSNWLGFGKIALPQHAGDSAGDDGSIDHSVIDITPGDLGK